MKKQSSVIVEVDEVTRGIMDTLNNQLVEGITVALAHSIETMSDDIQVIQQSVELFTKEVTGKLKTFNENIIQISNQLQENNDFLKTNRAETSKEILSLNTTLKSEINESTSHHEIDLFNTRAAIDSIFKEARLEIDGKLTQVISIIDKQSREMTTILANQEAISTISEQLIIISDRINAIEAELKWRSQPFYKRISTNKER